MIGRCYVRGNDLQYDTADSQWQSYNELCDPRDDQTSEGMCLAGMSAAITQTEIFLGAPGCFNWQGEGLCFPVNILLLHARMMLNSPLIIFHHMQETHFRCGITLKIRLMM